MRTSSEKTAALIGVGSNVGDRLSWLRFARARIGALASTRVVGASSIWETEPVGGPPQGPYLNACLAVETGLSPSALLDALVSIESAAGRVRSERNAPRTLDLDVLLFGEEEIATDRLAVPHPRFSERAFALMPAAEVAGSWPVPPSRATVAELSAAVSRSGVRRSAGEDAWR